MTDAVFVALITAVSAIIVAVISVVGEVIKHKSKKSDDRKNHRGQQSKR